MAAQDLDKLKAELTYLLEKESKDFRAQNSDIKVHSFGCSVAQVKKECMAELKKREATNQAGQVLKALERIVDKQVPIMVANMYRDAKPHFGKLCKVKIGGNTTGFRIVLEPKDREAGTKIYDKIREFKGGKKDKKGHQDALIKALMKKIDELNTPNKKGESRGIAQLDPVQKQFFNIGHDKGYAVVEQMQSRAEHALFQFDATEYMPAELFESLEVMVSRENKTDFDVIRCSLESSRENKSKGSSIEQPQFNKMKRDLQAILDAMDANEWVRLGGSDSKLEKVVKRILNPFAKAGAKSSKLKTNIKDEKIKDKNSKAARKQPKRKKVTILPAYVDKFAPKSGRKAKSNDKSGSLFSYMAMINKKLPSMIKKNMRAPRLENQSGRFAASVKLQGVNTTPQGHPSFGYTYEEDPYQIFEVGTGSAPWATPQRDPRKLIDASIREIAGQMALGRFYTRRL